MWREGERNDAACHRDNHVHLHLLSLGMPAGGSLRRAGRRGRGVRQHVRARRGVRKARGDGARAHGDGRAARGGLPGAREREDGVPRAEGPGGRRAGRLPVRAPGGTGRGGRRRRGRRMRHRSSCWPSCCRGSGSLPAARSSCWRASCGWPTAWSASPPTRTRTRWGKARRVVLLAISRPRSRVSCGPIRRIGSSPRLTSCAGSAAFGRTTPAG